MLERACDLFPAGKKKSAEEHFEQLTPLYNLTRSANLNLAFQWPNIGIPNTLSSFLNQQRRYS